MKKEPTQKRLRTKVSGKPSASAPSNAGPARKTTPKATKLPSDERVGTMRRGKSHGKNESC